MAHRQGEAVSGAVREQYCADESGVAGRSLDEDRRKVMGWAVRHTGNVPDAEDLTHDVLVRAMTRGQSVDPAAYDSWLYRVTRNLFVDGVRRRQRVRFESLPQDAEYLLFEERTPETELVARALEPSVSEALLAMSEEYRTALILRHVYDLSYEEIAERTEAPSGTVRSRIHRGRRQLRDAVGRSGGFELAA